MDGSLALLSSITTVLGSVAFAALIFSGPLAPAMPLAFMAILTGTSIAGLVVGLMSAYPCNISGAQDQPAAILAIYGGGLTATAAAAADASIVILLAVIFVSTALFGIALTLLGYLRLGKFAQLIPYPVVGGFLVGVGLLVLIATIRFLSGMTLSMASLPALFEPHELVKWSPAVLASLLLYFGMKAIRHILFLPLGLVSVVVLFYAVAWGLGMTTAELQARGLLFSRPAEGGVAQILASLDPGTLAPSDILRALPDIGALVLVCILGVSVSTTALEIGAEQEMEPNRELRVHGLANLLACLACGLPAYTLVGPSLAYRQLGASTRWMPVLRSLFSMLIGVLGVGLLGYVPKVMVGALLLLFTYGILAEWGISARRRLGPADYSLVIIIGGAITLLGFLPGIALGIFVAALFFLVQYSRLNLIKLELTGSQIQSDVERPIADQRFLREAGSSVLIFEIQGYVFFGSAIGLVERIRRRIESSPARIEHVVLGFRHVDGLDATARFALKKLLMFANRESLRLYFSALPADQIPNLVAAGVIRGDLSNSFDATGQALEHIEEALLSGAGREPVPDDLEGTLATVLGNREQAKALLPMTSVKQVGAGEALFRQGDANNDIFVLLEGRLSALIDLGAGRSLRVRKFLPGALTGEMAFYDKGVRSATLVAEIDSRVGVISGGALARMGETDPKVAALFHIVAGRLMAHRILSMNDAVRALLS